MSLYTRIIDLQNLSRAWDKARQNKPACGVDNITWEMFDRNRKAELKQLNLELVNGEYNVLPVKNVTLFKNNKERTIALYCMRDKVLQQSAAHELTKIYDPQFTDCTYAYRPNKSALLAIQKVEKEAVSDRYQIAVKTDIYHFFDEIPSEMLKNKLREQIREEDVLELIITSSTAPMLDRDGEIRPKKLGIHQGTSLAPILSNIYLMDMDAAMAGKEFFYLRYSDDILILTKDKETAEKVLANLKTRLENLGLTMNEKKTMIGEIEAGFDFLGYHFDKSGKGIPAKAEDDLAQRLEGMWLSSMEKPLELKLKKGSEILQGWEQYFRGKQSIVSIYEFAVVTYMTRRKEVNRDRLIEARKNLHNIDLSICKYLVEVWTELGLSDLILWEYEDYFDLAAMDTEVPVSESSRDELLKYYAEMLVNETEDIVTELMQIYTDCGCYNRAGVMMERIRNLQNRQKNRPVIMIQENGTQEFHPMHLNGKSLDLYFQYFVGREDTYSQESVAADGRRSCEQVMEPLTPEILRRHLRGELTLGTYMQRTNATCKFMVFDVDISKQILLTADPKEMGAYMQKAAEETQKILRELARLGLNGYIEESGYRGYHVWVLFDSWIQTRYINMLQDIVESKIGKPDPAISIEKFPNKARLKAGKTGQAMKLPYGVHMKSGRQSRFLNENFEPVGDLDQYLLDIATYSPNTVKRIIGMNSSDPNGREVVREKTTVDEDISEFELTDNIRVVLENCNLMRYLCQKARKTGYLTHFERLSLLYVFGHMGEEGAEFLHQIMHFTLNYKYHVTQKFILKVPGKPISCLKLRDQYQQLTAEFGCSCNFRRTKNCYPSPVLHAIKSGSADDRKITLPVGRNLSKEKEARVCEELNINKKAQLLTGKIVDLKKQKRGIDKAVTKLERELEQIFDDAGIDCLELEMGLLVRRKKGDDYEWVIEL